MIKIINISQLLTTHSGITICSSDGFILKVLSGSCSFRRG